VPPGADSVEWRREKNEHMLDLTRLSRDGRLTTAKSVHMVHLDDASTIIAAIEEVLKRSVPSTLSAEQKRTLRCSDRLGVTSIVSETLALTTCFDHLRSDYHEKEPI
jgi:hypothetical protein